jgi:sugar (pentulose or hexulose) kinase
MRTIGIDVGTSALKAVLVDVTECVDVLATVHKPYAADGEPMRDPQVWAALGRQAVNELVDGATPDAIGFTGQMHGFIALDARGELTAPVKLWLDTDGAPALAEFVRRAGGPESLVRRTGNIPLPDFVLAKWLQALAADPDLPGRVERLLCVKDFVRQSFDPRADFVIDPNEACGTQLQNPFSGAWSEELITAARVPRRALPPIIDATAHAGDASASWAKLKGVPLVLGVGDQAAAKRALGARSAGLVSLSLGTSGVLSFTVERNALPSDWDGAFHLFPSGYGQSFEVIGTVPGFGATLVWLSRLLGRNVEDLDRLAATTRIGEAAPLFMPYLTGVGPPNPLHEVRAQFLDLDAGVTPERLVRGVYDGLAQEFRAILDDARALGIRAECIVASGGAARLPALSQTFAAYFDVDCVVADAADGSAIGAALLAADHLDRGNGAALEAQGITGVERVEPSQAWKARRAQILAEAAGRQSHSAR